MPRPPQSLVNPGFEERGLTFTFQCLPGGGNLPLSVVTSQEGLEGFGPERADRRRRSWQNLRS